MVTEHLLITVTSCIVPTMREIRFLLFLNYLRLPYSIPKSFALLLSFHSARHTFARTAKQQGVDNALLKNMLGHSKLETTERYMGDFDTIETDKAMEKIFATEKETQTSELLEILKSKSPEEITALIQQLKG